MATLNSQSCGGRVGTLLAAAIIAYIFVTVKIKHSYLRNKQFKIFSMKVKGITIKMQ